MSWIESHQEMKDNPKTVRLARRLKIEIPHAIGCLHCLWWWAITYAQDGALYRYDNLDIAYAMMWNGDADELVEALETEHFLDVDENGYSIHDWRNYAGKLLEKRRSDSERKRNAAGAPSDNSREGRGTSTERTRNGRGTDAEEKRNSTLPYSTVPNNKNIYALTDDEVSPQTAADCGESPPESNPNPNASCAEPPPGGDAPRRNPVIALTLNDKTEYPIFEEQTQEWAALYPAVDVMQQLRSMKGWIDSNPQKRKTKSGILKFINGWLSREQDRGGNLSRANQSAPDGNAKPSQPFEPSTGGRSLDEYRSGGETP
jgi:hypothetical protein